MIFLNNKIIIGLTGSIGSGCTKIAKDFLVEKKKFHYVSLSDYIKQNVDKNDPNILDYQDFGNKCRKNENEKDPLNLDFLPKQILKKHPKLFVNDLVIIDSIRNPGEIEYYRRNYPNFYLIGVYADKKVRKNRILSSKFDGNENLFEQAEERDRGDVWEYGQQVTRCMDLADIIVINNYDFDKDISQEERLYNEINNYLKLIQIPGRKTPTQIEINMNKAYAISLRSECLKRQVGAVIIDNDSGKLISEGFNRNPSTKIESCLKLYKKCYRDTQRDTFYEALNTCSACGKEYNIPDNCENIECNFGIVEHLKNKIKLLDFCRALHAEEDAILNALTDGFKNFENYTLYTTTFPCLMCAKKIITVGIRSIIFLEPYPFEMAKEMLEKAEIKINIFEGIKNDSYYKLFKKQYNFDKKIKK